MSASSRTRATIGRDVELAGIEELLAGLDEGPRVLFLLGPPGIGKTKVWAEGVELARSRGVRVLTTRPAGADARVAFAALRDLLGDAAEEVLPELPAPQRRALAVALLLEEPGPKSPEPDALSASLVGALRLLARPQPLLVAVDDAQWLDASSLALLAFALRRLDEDRVGVLATVRVERGVNVDNLLAALASELTERRDLPPLTVAALYELVRERYGLSLARPTLLRLHELSGGNPFFALELARGLSENDELTVPRELSELLRARLGALSEPTQEVLLAAAAVARPTREVLEQVDEGVDATLAEAVAADIIDLEQTVIRFTHPLLASVHYEAASSSARRAVHRRLAEADLEAEERMHHLALAADGPDEEVAAVVAAAASGAEARGAVPAAANLAATAVRLTPPSRRARLHRRRLEAARLAFAAGDRASAERMLNDALAVARPGTERAETLLELGVVLGSEDLRAGLSLLRDAAAEPVTDARLRASILTRLAPREGYSGPGYERAKQLASEAVALLEETTDGKLLARALATLGHIEFSLGRALPDAVMRRAEALETAFGISVDGPTELYAEMLAYCGRHAEARERLERVIAVGRETGDAGVCWPLFRLAYLKWEVGEWESAWELGLEGRDIAAQSGRDTVAPLGNVVLALVDAMRGNVEEGRARGLAALEATDRAGRHSGGPRGALALIELSLERYRETYELLEPYFERIRGLGSDLPGTDQATARSTSDAIEALTYLGRLDEARDLLAPLEDTAHRLDIPWASVAAARCRGFLALAMSDLEAAEAALAEAVRVGGLAGMPLELGRSLLALGSAQRQRRRKGEARATLERAVAVFEELGATIWLERARKELRRIGGRSAPAGDELSATEARIAELVVAGRSNKEVAQTLHLSAKTVEWNLSKVYRKLGVRSRTELAARFPGV